MEARRNRSVMSKKADGGRDSKKRQSKRRQQSADLFRRHQLREEGQTFQRVCGFAIECGVPVSIDLINDAIGGDDVVVKPTSALAQKAAAVATAVKAGQRPVVEGPDLVRAAACIFSVKSVQLYLNSMSSRHKRHLGAFPCLLRP